MTDEKVMPWVSRQIAKREIKKLNRKIIRLEKELDRTLALRRKNLDFEYAFRRFYARFKRRDWKCDWPIERIDEAMLTLKEVLDK